MQKLKGWTLVELVCCMALAGLVFTLSAIVVRNGLNHYFTAKSATSLTTQSAVVMSQLSLDLQQAATLSTMNSNAVTLTRIDGTTITYSWTSPNLTRTISGQTAQTIGSPVSAFVLTYYQIATFGATTASAGNVAAVTINMTFGNSSESVPLINTVYLVNA